MSVIILNRAIVHYEALGRGRPVIFLHSWVGSWRYWLDSMQVASTGYRAYALDFYGYGDTTHDPDFYDIESQTALVAGFLDELGMDRVAIIGHGLGACVGLLLAARQPARVARILAVSVPLESDSINPRLRSAGPVELADWLSSHPPGGGEALSEASRADPEVARASIRHFRPEELFLQLRDADLTCLLVYGQEDPSMLAPSPDRTWPLGPSVHQVNLDQSGHFPMLDSADRFHRLLADFLALDQGASPRDLQLREEWRRRVR